LPYPSVDRFIDALSRRDILGEEERLLLASLPRRLKEFSADEEIIREGSQPKESCLVLEGFAARAQHLSTGKRQLTAVHIPGDFVDLHSLLLKVMDHGVVALSKCKVVFIPHENLRSITETHPHLGRLLWLSTLIDGAIQRAWITCMGRRSAAQHLAHLVCELYRRLEVVGLARDFSFEFPVTQSELGDMLGLSDVHVNRILQELRGSGLVQWQAQRIAIPDFQSLSAFCDFDPTYLNLVPSPR
jgi:CRP-like cAMP-binding protein